MHVKPFLFLLLFFFFFNDTATTEIYTLSLHDALPICSQKATEFWAQMALNTRCAFINCIPAFIASNVVWEKRFQEKKIPIIGDDIKGQVGATIVHRVLAKLCSDRGTKIDQTYQLNVGGNTDFLNMKELERLKSKKVSKTEAVVSQVAQELDAGDRKSVV